MSADQIELALGLITVHCFTCPHTVTGTTPTEAHDLMEKHYEDCHIAFIRAIAGSNR